MSGVVGAAALPVVKHSGARPTTDAGLLSDPWEVPASSEHSGARPTTGAGLLSDPWEVPASSELSAPSRLDMAAFRFRSEPAFVPRSGMLKNAPNTPRGSSSRLKAKQLQT